MMAMFDEAIARLLARVDQQMQTVIRGEQTLAQAAAVLGIMPSELEAIYRQHLLGRTKRAPIKAQ